jgi:ankyrin repeat protein
MAATNMKKTAQQALIDAFLTNDVKAVECLLNLEGTSVEEIVTCDHCARSTTNCCSCIGNTLLHEAVMKENLALISILLEHGADINAKNNMGESPLLFGCRKKKADAVYFLLAKGASEKVVDNFGETALHIAVGKNHQMIVERLLNRGYDINAQSYHGNTPLHCAAYYGYTEIVKILLTNGAQVDIQNNELRTALHNSCIYYRVDVAKLLLKCGANINTVDEDGYTPLALISNARRDYNAQPETGNEKTNMIRLLTDTESNRQKEINSTIIMSQLRVAALEKTVSRLQASILALQHRT